MIKKVLVSLCVLPLLLTACSKDEVIAPVADSGKAISFGTVLAPASRGAVVNKTQLQATGYGFRVSAYNQGNVTSWATYLTNVLPVTGPNFMANEDVTWNTTWGYTNAAYWPGKINATDYGHVTFFGLGGLLSGVPQIAYTGTNNAPEFEYTTLPAAASQNDLVADVQFDQYWSAGKQVRFAFKHILSKIGFTAKLAAAYSDVTVKVTNLKVVYAANKVESKGTYAFNTNATTANDGWTLAGTNYLSGDSEELISSDVTLNTTAAPLSGEYLMLIPQTTAADGDLTVELTYTVTQGGVLGGPYIKTYSIPARAYAMGKQYTYNFTFTLNKVEFVLDNDLDVSGWGNPETVDEPADIPVQ